MTELIFKGNLPPKDEFERRMAEAIGNSNPVDDLLRLAKRLNEFERQYDMLSDDFYRQFQSGLLNDELQHCFEWEGLYEAFLETKRRIENGLMRAATQPPWEEVKVAAA